MPRNEDLRIALTNLNPLTDEDVEATIKALNDLSRSTTADQFQTIVFKNHKILNFNRNGATAPADIDIAELGDNPDNTIEVLKTELIPAKKASIILEQVQRQVLDKDSLVEEANIISTRVNDPASIAPIKQAVDDKMAAVDKAKAKYDAVHKRMGMFVLQNRKGKSEATIREKKILTDRMITHAEVQAAWRLVEESIAIAQNQATVAEKSKLNIEKAIAEAEKPGVTADEAINQTNIARKEFFNLKQALHKVKDAERDIEHYKKIALNPKDVFLKELRATTLMEKYGLLGFTDTLVIHGEKPPVSEKAAATLSLYAGRPTVFQGVRLNAGDTIHSTLKVASGGEIRLIQNAEGHITDDSSNLKEAEKELAAVKIAKMILLNYDPKNGPVFISGGDKAQVGRVYAALLLVSQNNPDNALKRSDICSETFDFSAPGWFSTNKGFIATHLPNLDKKVVSDEQATLVAKQKDFKDNYKEAGIEVKDLPSTFRLKGN